MAKKLRYIENLQGWSRQKIGKKTMGIAKIPIRTSWAKVTW